MDHSCCQIGTEFRCGEKIYRCTDVGSRSIVAIRVDGVEVSTMSNGDISTKILARSEAETDGWFNGPPYAIAEIVFDEYDLEDCEPI